MALQIDGKDEITPFLEDLQKSRKQAFGQLRARFRVLCEDRHYQNEYTFKNLGKGLYEIKTHSGVRVYAFLDDLDPDVSEQQLVITACGGGKNTKGAQARDIERARNLRKQYLAARKQEDTRLTFLKHPDED